jgi:hypothetical protein
MSLFLSSSNAPAADLPADDQSLLLWRIARRADELVHETSRGPGLNRICWLIAEQELLGRLQGAVTLLRGDAALGFLDAAQP